MGRDVRWIEDIDGLLGIAAAWDDLAALDPTPFSLSAWYAAWWEGYGGGRTMRVCTV